MKRKLPARYAPFVFVFLVAFPLSGTISLINTFLEEGLHSIFLQHWIRNWAVGFLLVYPFALIFVRLARKIIVQIVHS